MPQVRFITSDSQMGAPGVYVKEDAPAVPVRGQRNRVIGFAGTCVRGPTGKLVECATYQRFLDVFGDRDRNTKGGTIMGQVWKALQGKRWGRLYVARVAADDAVKASFTFETAAAGGGTPVLRVDAANVGIWGNDVSINIYDATNGDANYFNLAVKLYGKVKVYENITIAGSADNTNSVIGTNDATLIRLAKIANGRPVTHAATVDGADADGYVNLGEVVGAFTSVAGTEGTLANTDYTVTDGPMEMLNNARGIHACAVVGNSAAAIKTKVETLSATSAQRVWYVCPDDEDVTFDDAVTERAGISSDRISYWFNHPYITDPITGEEIVEEPFVVVMSIISQTDPDVHPGDFDNAVLTKALRRVTFELGDTTRDALDAGGVSFIHRDQDQNGNDVIIPGNALTCDFAVNNQDLDARYMKDFVLDALAQRLRGDHFKGNTPANRAARASACSSFLNVLAKSERYIQTSEDGVPQYQYVNDMSVNSEDEQAEGIQRELLIARLIPKNKKILLQATIGVDATISEQ